MAHGLTAPHFHAGQRVVCVDATPNRRCDVKMLYAGQIYVIRAIDVRPGWASPRWGVHLEGISIIHPDNGSEWPFHPKRFRPVTERPTDITIFEKLLTDAPSEQPAQRRQRIPG